MAMGGKGGGGVSGGLAKPLPPMRACRDAMSRMKEGEEEKTKSYQALVWTQKSIREDDVAFINRIKVGGETSALPIAVDDDGVDVSVALVLCAGRT